MSLPSRIALVGFMGSGKTTVGRLLAGRIGFDFADSDREIESRAGLPVGEIFRVHGEAFFRDLEEAAIRDLLTFERRVIATGGGAFARPAAAEALLEGAFTIHLDCDFHEAFRRAAAEGGRPLVEKGEADVASLYVERKDKYSRAHVTVDTTRLPPEDVVKSVLRLLPSP
ncbi:MAG: shikimate kinase [Vicinamibacteria bacterium]|nr:shikimate kinase [Vicinamibacteria bacterium]